MFNRWFLVNHGPYSYFRKWRWFHHCSTWSRSYGTYRYYHDGNIIFDRYVGGTLKLGGYLSVGSKQFDGEITKLNVFSRELDAGEVRRMKEAGIISNIEKNYEEHRYFKWEDILTWERSSSRITERIMTTPEETKDGW